VSPAGAAAGLLFSIVLRLAHCRLQVHTDP
jgi:hypothetical protein